MSHVDLKAKAQAIRLSVLEMVSNSGSSHIAAAFSIVDILTVLYFSILTIDPKNPDSGQRDRFLLSKGHGGAALYATLAHRGFVPLSELDNYAKAGSAMAGHIVRHSVPGIETTAGSLGHGLPMGAGMAIALKKPNAKQRVFVLMGDGECNEGAVWEAAMVSAHFKLNNLVVIVDKNGEQSMGKSADIMNMEPFVAKWQAFGWNVVECDGHNFSALSQAFLQHSADKPTAVIAKTSKGKGVSFMEENPLAWHYKTPKAESLVKAREELTSHA